MEAGVTTVTVKYLIGIIVVRAEAYFAVSLEEFLLVMALKSFGRFHIKILLILHISLQHFLRLIFESMLKRSQHCCPIQFIPIFLDFDIKLVHLPNFPHILFILHIFYKFIPVYMILTISSLKLPLP